MAQMKVRYKGAADVREMKAADLKRHGVVVSKDLVWDASNGWSLDMDMTDELEKILRADGAFRLEAIKDGGNDTDVEVESSVNDDTADTVVMADTGQVDKKK
jgi:hypothetical protein